MPATATNQATSYLQKHRAGRGHGQSRGLGPLLQVFYLYELAIFVRAGHACDCTLSALYFSASIANIAGMARSYRSILPGNRKQQRGSFWLPRFKLTKQSIQLDLNHRTQLEDWQVHSNNQATNQYAEHRHNQRLHQSG